MKYTDIAEPQILHKSYYEFVTGLNLILFISTEKPGCSLHSPIDYLSKGRLAVNFQHLNQ